MKKFVEPEIEIKELMVQDVITTSDMNPEDWETERG